MSLRRVAMGWLILALGAPVGQVVAQAAGPGAAEAAARVEYLSAPLAFEPNAGQLDESVEFLARGPGYAVFLTDTEAVLSLHGESGEDVLRLQVVGGATSPKITGEAPTGAKVNVYHGDDPSKWAVGLETVGKVRYTGVYPGIDLLYYGNQRRLEHDFVLAPGADPQRIKLRLAGAEKLRVAESGELVVTLPHGEIGFAAPVAYQEQNGVREPVESSYRIVGRNEVVFRVGRYDRGRELVIDPLVGWSAYVGGSGEDQAWSVKVDGDALYAAGYTSSTNLPSPVVGSGNTGGTDAFVSRLNSDGSVVWSAYVGGSGADHGFGVAVDGGAVYVAGYTMSANLPNPVAGSHAGGHNDAFATRLTTEGALVWSAYVGGTGSDSGMGVAASGGAVYVVGTTNSTNLPRLAPGSAIPRGFDAFVSRLSGDGTVAWSTCIGGSGHDYGRAVAVDGGAVYIAGFAESSDLPRIVGGSAYVAWRDAFVARLNGDGALAWSACIGGSNYEHAFGVAAGEGAVYVAGLTGSADLPCPVDGSNHLRGYYDAFVTRLNSDGNLAWTAYFGGSSSDFGWAVSVDRGAVYLTGYTESGDLPATVTGSSHAGGTDAFVARLRSDGSLVWSGYVGGSSYDYGYGVAAQSGVVYVAGFTGSSNLPRLVAGSTYAGSGDAFVAKLIDDTPPFGPIDETPPVITVPDPLTAEQDRLRGAEVAFTVSAEDDVDGAVTPVCTLNGETIASPYVFPLGVSTVTVTADDAAGHTATATFTVTVEDTTAPVLHLPEPIQVEQQYHSGSPVAFAPTATDICDAEPTIVCDPPSDTIFQLGQTEVTVTATDDSGNVAEATFMVTVVDTTAPVFGPAAPVTVEQTNRDGTLVELTAPEVSDICDNDVTITNNAPAVFPLGVTQVTWTATDDSGNQSTTTQQVTVVDTTAPAFGDLVPVTVEQTDRNGTPVAMTPPTVTDICDAAPQVTSNAPEVFPLGTTTVTWTATDASGNSATVTQTVTVQDTTAPQLAQPAAVTAEQAALAGTAVALTPPQATDICDAAPQVTSDAPAVFPLGTTLVTWTATDASGNTATVTQEVTVQDTTAPSLTVPGAITVEQMTAAGTAVAIGQATATDACDAAPQVTHNAPAIFPLGTTAVTWRAVDVSGNVATAVQLVTVRDTLAPQLTLPAPITVKKTSSRGAMVAFTVGVQDICDAAPQVVCRVGTMVIVSPNQFPVGTSVVQVTATDASGNVATGSFTVKVTSGASIVVSPF